MIIDSWYLRRLSPDQPAEACGLDEHLRRYTHGVQQFYGRRPPDRFLHSVRRACEDAPVGEWFPRLEATASEDRLSWRPSPLRRRVTRLLIGECARDPRRHPTLKGPDLPELTRLRNLAVEHGADDLVLAVGGRVLEASTLAVLLLAGERLIVPAGPRLPSVSEDLFLRRQPVCPPESGRVVPRWAELCRREVSVEELLEPRQEAGEQPVRVLGLNALHGVTEVAVVGRIAVG